MARKRVFDTWSKQEQLVRLFGCLANAMKEVSDDPRKLDRFKDPKMFRFASTFSKYIKFDDFEEIRGMTVHEAAMNTVALSRIDEENETE